MAMKNDARAQAHVGPGPNPSLFMHLCVLLAIYRDGCFSLCAI